MVSTKYAFENYQENMARAQSKGLPISTKTAIEMSNFLRGRTTEKAKLLLERILKKEQALPMKRFTDGVGHRKGPIAAGRYPQKASEEFLKLVKIVEANAREKGLGESLKIVHLAAQKGSNDYHYGRQRRRTFKRTTIEIVVEEVQVVANKKKSATPSNKEVVAEKTETKPKTGAQPKAETKTNVEAKQTEQPKTVKKENIEKPKTESQLKDNKNETKE